VKIKTIILLLNCFLIFRVHSQKETSNWLFGDRNWLSFYPNIQTKDSCNTYFEEPCASISDKSGNLIFYSNGESVFNKYHRVIKKGDSLLGDWSASEGCVFVQKPGNDSVFYLFTNDFALQSDGLCYNVIKLHGNPDSSVVIEKNIRIASKMCESISVIHHQNGIYKWIVVHSGISNTISAFLLTDKGLNPCPIETTIGYVFNGAVLTYQTVGKFNNDGTLWAIDNMVDGIIKICSFDNSTGLFSNSFVLPDYYDIISGMQFSKNSKYLYVIERELQLVQVNTKSWQKKVIFNISSTGGRMSRCQFGIDGKMYMYRGDSSFLSSIENPDQDGVNCNFKERSIFLKHKNTSGLPNFDQSYFYTPSVYFKYKINCINNSISFEGVDTFSGNTFKWIIEKKGKPVEATYTTKNINHTFLDTGIYKVTYIVSNGNSKDTMTKSIVIYPKLSKQFLGKDTAYAQGTSFNKILKTPLGMHCQLWQDSSRLSTFHADTAGVYICKVTNKSFCDVIDTIIISECINNLTQPSLYRSRDSLYTYQPVADSFVWFRNNVQYRITKEPFIRLNDTGTYRVEAAKKGHCNRSSITNHVNKLGINYFLSSDFNIQLFPIPSSEQVFIKADKDFILQVSDITGRIITVQENIDSISLPKGVYFFTFTIDAYKITEKVVVL
jgi:PKD repeat protein